MILVVNRATGPMSVCPSYLPDWFAGSAAGSQLPAHRPVTSRRRSRSSPLQQCCLPSNGADNGGAAQLPLRQDGNDYPVNPSGDAAADASGQMQQHQQPSSSIRCFCSFSGSCGAAKPVGQAAWPLAAARDGEPWCLPSSDASEALCRSSAERDRH